MNEYVAWLDGGCGPVNPGGTATSRAIIKDKEGTVLLKESRLVGKGDGMSNNVAEYAAVIRVFKYLATLLPGHVIVQGDSKLVINQLIGKWAARKGLYYSTYLEARELLYRLRSLGWQIDLLWIPRTQNEECDALSRGHWQGLEYCRRFSQIGMVSVELDRSRRHKLSCPVPDCHRCLTSSRRGLVSNFRFWLRNDEPQSVG
jgi:ribonuclease HI